MIKSGWRKRDEYEDSIIVVQIDARIDKKIFVIDSNQLVAKRHQMVSGSLALLYCFSYSFLFSYFNRSRAAAPVGDEVL